MKTRVSDNWAEESWESSQRKVKRICKKLLAKFPKEENMWKLRIGKTIYLFKTYYKLKNKLKQLDTIEYEMAAPGEKLSAKKTKL